MKTPSWAKATAIVAIIFGAYGIYGNAQLLLMPTILQQIEEQAIANPENQEVVTDTIYDYQYEIDEITNDTLSVDTTQTITTSTNGINDKDLEEIQELLPEVMTWSVRFGTIGIFVAIFFTIAAVFMLYPKKISPKLFYTALIASILFRVSILVVFLSSGNLILMIACIGSAIVVLSDLTFLFITIFNDKSFYYGRDPNEDFSEYSNEVE